jgi:subtilisin family serine protease
MKNIRFALNALIVVAFAILIIPCTTLAGNQANDTSGNIASELSAINPYVDQQQYQLNIQPSEAGTANNEVLVAVLDTGIDVNHKDLSNKVIESINFTKSPTIKDIVGHGTHIAGIIASEKNGIISAGASSNVKLLNVKVAEDNGIVWASVVAKGIVWATDRGAQVINMSLVLPAKYQPVEEAIRYAWDHGVVMTAAAGNYVKCNIYPAAYNNVLAVGATNSDGQLWEGSNDSDFVKAYAPGVSILSTVPGNKYAYLSGTSMSSAYVSAVGARAINQIADTNNNDKSSDEVMDLLMSLFPKTNQ